MYLKRRIYPKIVFILLCSLFFASYTASAEDDSFRFTITADMRHNHEGFRRVCRAINEVASGPGVFHISAGDINPPHKNRNVIDEEFGEDTVWYPVVGNHELDDRSGKDMDWIRNEFSFLPYIVNDGPQYSEETTYSFDYGNAHFVVLNEYYNGTSDIGTDGDIVPELFDWLEKDLNSNTKPMVFVFGHEPAFPKADSYWKNGRHYGNSLDKYRENRDEFWNLLEEKNVIAYICGHIHRYSRYQHDGGKVWQVVPVACPPPGNSGKYDAWINVIVYDNKVTFEVYRDLDVDGTYTLYDEWTVT